jgi:HD-GYP domain-containing protein (c-di-GMP phosphodiesterase class II)
MSHRPYRAALGLERALEEIKLNSGILYDPVVTDACFRISSNGGIKLNWE